MSPSVAITAHTANTLAGDDLFTHDELEALLRCSEDLEHADMSDACTELVCINSESMHDGACHSYDECDDQLYAAFCEALDMPLTMAPLFPDELQLPAKKARHEQQTSAPVRVALPTTVKTLEFSSMSTYSLAVAAGMALGCTIAYWDQGTLSFHFSDERSTPHWIVPSRVPDFMLGPDWLPYVVVDENVPRFDVRLGDASRASHTIAATPVNVYVAFFFRMTGKCVSLVPAPRVVLDSTEHGPCVQSFRLSRDMMPNMYQHGFYVARVVVSFDHLQQAGAPKLAALPSCVATPAFNVAPNAAPKTDRDHVRGVVRQTAMLVASHVCTFAPPVLAVGRT